MIKISLADIKTMDNKSFSFMWNANDILHKIKDRFFAREGRIFFDTNLISKKFFGDQNIKNYTQI